MGGMAGREEGIMYSDSSSLSCASSAAKGLSAAEGLGTNKKTRAFRQNDKVLTSRISGQDSVSTCLPENRWH